MPEKQLTLRILKRGDKRELPVVIDPYQLRPILKNMGLGRKSTEAKIADLIAFAVQPRRFQTPKGIGGDEYASIYASIPLIFDEGTCRHRTALLSALLESARIPHDIVAQGVHTMVSIPLNRETVLVDFRKGAGPVAFVDVKRDGQHRRWGMQRERIHLPATRELDRPSLLSNGGELKGHPDFRSGMNKALLEKAVRQAEWVEKKRQADKTK